MTHPVCVQLAAKTPAASHSMLNPSDIRNLCPGYEMELLLSLMPLRNTQKSLFKLIAH